MVPTHEDVALKANLVDFASELSYRKSGKEPERQAKGTEVSGQTVLKAVRLLDTRVQSEADKERRKVKVLYIEADEDHVPSQDGTNVEVPLVYVHEGKFRQGSRSHLKNVHYFSGVYSHAEELWYDVLNYINCNYDLDKVEHIYICGDGAKWIRLGTKIIPKSTFVLDRYHLARYIAAALGKGNELSREIWQAIRDVDLEKAKAVLKKAYRSAQTEGRRKAVKQCRRYIVGNWDGIKVYKTSPEVIGCSAEGHVSHVLSARLSSRPMGWSRPGMDQMARIRVLKANGINIKEQYLKQLGKPATVLKVCQTSLQQQRKLLERPPFETLGNIPALKGPTTSLAQILRAIKSA
ncbi:ISLre2 family transposase [Desulfofundulus thermocisternus]|uniref:ISLre2 family transposase n=1 Tax=Desulfofundulus thermocisternus TaxID=42471 RepID=UPI00217CDF39|nr:ISLre2 family transposase [Desulfofundulus thermocisternus]MCS5695838.1 ISLre2 family transposase [Desulfofundulus thermocisternus]